MQGEGLLGELQELFVRVRLGGVRIVALIAGIRQKEAINSGTANASTFK